MLLLLPGISAQITVSVIDARNFCLMLPPKPGQNIGDTEGESLARCSSYSSAQAAGDDPQLFPSGFIQSAHYISNSEYSQVTGTLDRNAYQLSASDDGGEYDSDPNGSRPGSKCAGFESYFSYVEPSSNIFCIRCCHTGGDCDSSQDTAGCEGRIKGNYGPGFTNQGRNA